MTFYNIFSAILQVQLQGRPYPTLPGTYCLLRTLFFAPLFCTSSRGGLCRLWELLSRHADHARKLLRAKHDAGRLPVYPFPIIMPWDQICDELSNPCPVEVRIR
jgi:hypothetical protein